MVKKQFPFERYDIWLVDMEPTRGSEISKTRPALIVSPTIMNRNINTVIVAPMTTARKNWPTRLDVSFMKITGQVALDQIRSFDKLRFVKRLGELDNHSASKVSAALVTLFRE